MRAWKWGKQDTKEVKMLIGNREREKNAVKNIFYWNFSNN